MDLHSLQDQLLGSPAVTPALPLTPLLAGGEDAESFLQGQLTMDLRGLGARQQRLTAWCNAKGRVWAVLRILRCAQGFVLLLPSDQIEDFERRMRLFVLRAKVDFSRPELIVQGHVGADAPTDWVCEDAGCWLPLGPGQALSLLREPLPAQAADAGARFKALRLLGGEPQINAATREKFLPQSLGLEALDGLHFNKGCYVGQEIVARVHYRGRAPQRLVTLINPQENHLDGKFLLDEACVAGQRVVQAVEYVSDESAA